jgi:hypothetical protein
MNHTPAFNLYEQAFEKFALEQGWSPTKRGWPDFFVPELENGACVEVKHRSLRLQIEQSERMAFLVAHGIPCYRWDPIVGLARYDVRDKGTRAARMFSKLERSCGHCGRSFEAFSPTATYCGGACRTAALRRRRTLSKT